MNLRTASSIWGYVHLYKWFPGSWGSSVVSVCICVGVFVCVYTSVDFVLFLCVWACVCVCVHSPLSAAYWHVAPLRWATPLAPQCVACCRSSDWSAFLVWSAGPASLTPSCSAPASAALSDNHRHTSRNLVVPFSHHWVNRYTFGWQKL